MDELNECCQNNLIRFVKASWLAFPEETKIAFKTLAKATSPMTVISLTFETKKDRQKTNTSLAALEALQLISFTQSGQAKLYQITDFGSDFAENVLKII
ncbi:hypothetical protein Desaci_4747 (plasmid) [Desulfosporosinus acidiphilus SJ4]|jgi:predicted MarR family transcription regulator|uniref:Transcriptional regulator n=1 Tax=Desulfosporosinus acidiphilus (strain DSM 22704 / JCM 16185 / SJ4) TaxID=646529 RepID=I4DCP9_DESAJ|nr:hypothetical protein [Desulfosporosinus acidiphilus]AFM43573.1 hypothetical protein Desaci_4747 [Desulfosporosinus acidiphilus SJ4]